MPPSPTPNPSLLNPLLIRTPPNKSTRNDENDNDVIYTYIVSTPTLISEENNTKGDLLIRNDPVSLINAKKVLNAVETSARSDWKKARMVLRMDVRRFWRALTRPDIVFDCCRVCLV